MYINSGIARHSETKPRSRDELQNLIERAVIRSNDDVLSNPLPLLDPTPLLSRKPTTLNSRSGTFSECTRSLILGALEDTGWMIGGPNGAAARLGLRRTTLISKMKKLGISRPKIRNMTNVMAEKTEPAAP
jgi:transcriptional regulator with GAF, ATPase, and Fis domain